MTGFGRACFEVEGVEFVLEVRSVNHRFLDVHVRLPRFLSALEGEVRAQLRRLFGRGKLDVALSTPGAGALPGRVEVDSDAAGEYLAAAQRLSRSHGVAGDVDVATLLSLPGVARFADARPAEDAMRTGFLAGAPRSRGGSCGEPREPLGGGAEGGA
jgi:uncharacterized protein (TIGR00255 family)